MSNKGKTQSFYLRNKKSYDILPVHPPRGLLFSRHVGREEHEHLRSHVGDALGLRLHVVWPHGEQVALKGSRKLLCKFICEQGSKKKK